MIRKSQWNCIHHYALFAPDPLPRLWQLPLLWRPEHFERWNSTGYCQVCQALTHHTLHKIHETKSSHVFISNPRMQHQLLRLAVLHISCTLVKHREESAAFMGWISWIKKCVRIATAQLCKCVLPTSPACQAKLPIHGMQHLMDCKQEGRVFREGTATVRNRETWLAALDAVKHGFQIYAPIHQHQLKGTEDGSNCCTNWV